MRREQGIRKSGGFSLVEAILAIALLGFAFLAMGKLMVASGEHSKQGRHDMIALNASDEVLERMRSVDFDLVKPLFHMVDTADSSSVPVEARHWATHLAENLGPTARGQIRIYDEKDDPQLTRGILEVEILTSWVERGRERSMHTGTYIVRMGS